MQERPSASTSLILAASGANRFANVASARVRKRTDNRKDLVHN
jgi:hypothetical protein